MDGLGHFGTVCRLKQEPDPDCDGTNEILVLANGFSKSDDIAVGERGGNFGSESYWGRVPDLEQVGAMMGR